ncbi:hypothetical protein D3C87_1918240 [compost metagenome]
MNRHTFGPARVARVLERFVSDHDDALDPFGMHLMGNRRHVQGAIVLLPTGHGHSIVEENLEGDIGARGNRCANTKEA